MGKFLVFLLVLVLIEVPLFRFAASRLSIPYAWLLMLGTALLGCWMVLRGLTLRSVRSKSEVGPRELLLEPIGNVLCGTLLFVPGFFSDFLGLLLLIIPPLRVLMAALFLKYLGKKALSSKGRVMWNFRYGSAGDPPNSPEPLDKSAESSREAPEIWEANGPPEEESIRDAQFEVFDKPEDASPNPPRSPAEVKKSWRREDFR